MTPLPPLTTTNLSGIQHLQHWRLQQGLFLLILLTHHLCDHPTITYAIIIIADIAIIIVIFIIINKTTVMTVNILASASLLSSLSSS